MGLRFLIFSVAIIFGACQQVSANQISDTTRDALERFYHHFGGNDWHINDGWLNPAVDPCLWHGVRCSFSAGVYGVTSISLPANNLTGTLEDSDIFDHVYRVIDLPDNRISGELDRLPYWLERLVLSGNQLEGTLPSLPNQAQLNIFNISLARNQFTGSVPESWRRLSLSRLDLADNRLAGSVEPAFAALSTPCCGSLNLASNAYEGVIPQTVIGAGVHEHDRSIWGGGINLCWNDLVAETQQLHDWLEAHHVGGADFSQCVGRPRLPVDTEISGSWYDSARAGEGIVMHLLPNDSPLVYAFTFDGLGTQHWMIGVGTNEESSLHWQYLPSARGRFGQGRLEGPWPAGPVARGFGTDWRLDRTGLQQMHLERIYQDFGHCPDHPASPMPCASVTRSDRLNYSQLTRLAGTTCENRNPNQSLSGAWYDPEREGEGFVIEVLESGAAVVYWFTYQPGDSNLQAWMMGDGAFDGQVLTIDNLVQPIGGRWGSAFDASAINFRPWGSLVIEFFDDLNGHIHYDSLDEAYGSGDYPIERLSKVRLAECED